VGFAGPAQESGPACFCWEEPCFGVSAEPAAVALQGSEDPARTCHLFRLVVETGSRLEARSQRRRPFERRRSKTARRSRAHQPGSHPHRPFTASVPPKGTPSTHPRRERIGDSRRHRIPGRLDRRLRIGSLAGFCPEAVFRAGAPVARWRSAGRGGSSRGRAEPNVVGSRPRGALWRQRCEPSPLSTRCVAPLKVSDERPRRGRGGRSFSVRRSSSKAAALRAASAALAPQGKRLLALFAPAPNARDDLRPTKGARVL
jgi:hypothetical protein